MRCLFDGRGDILIDQEVTVVARADEILNNGVRYSDCLAYARHWVGRSGVSVDEADIEVLASRLQSRMREFWDEASDLRASVVCSDGRRVEIRWAIHPTQLDGGVALHGKPLETVT